MTRPAIGKAHIPGRHAITTTMVDGTEVGILLHCGAACSGAGPRSLKNLLLNWENKVTGDSNENFGDCSESHKAIGVIEIPVIYNHNQGSVRIKPKCVFVGNATPGYFI